MAYAYDSKSYGRKALWVQVPPPAPRKEVFDMKTRKYRSGECSRCEKIKLKIHKSRQTGEPVCTTCNAKTDYRRRKGKICSRCSKPGIVALRSSPTGLICSACYQRYYRLEICSVCQESRTVVARVNGQNPVCSACYHRVINQATCVYCKRVRPIKARDAHHRPICGNCIPRRSRRHDEKK